MSIKQQQLCFVFYTKGQFCFVLYFNVSKANEDHISKEINDHIVTYNTDTQIRFIKIIFGWHKLLLCKVLIMKNT